jgi:hypothetical protein
MRVHAEYCQRSDEDKFLNGEGRFKRRTELANCVFANEDLTRENWTKIATEHAARDQRSGFDRRCGFDVRSELENFLQGERRSPVRRRSAVGRRYRSFKTARVFVRNLGLTSEREWRRYIEAGLVPKDIPVAPDHVYWFDGWAGWSDWLGASPLAMSLSQIWPFPRTVSFPRAWRGNNRSSQANL